MAYKNIYVAATSQHVGKTTSTLGLVSSYHKAGLNVGYCKPVGQKHIAVNGMKVDKDAILFSDLLKEEIDPKIHSPVILGKGTTELILDDPTAYDLDTMITYAENKLSEKHDLVIYEGTGHPGVGSIGNVSNAKVAKLLNASVIMIVEGGIGSTIDMLNLCLSIFKEEGVEVIGVIINKVIPEKKEKVEKYVGKWLKSKNLELLGVIPYDRTLAYPLIWTVNNAIGGTIEHNNERGYQKVEKIIAGSLINNSDFTDSENMLLVVSPRSIDEAITKIVKYTESKELSGSPLSGIVITGKDNLSEFSSLYIENNKIPLIRTDLDTYGAVLKISRIEVKINRRTPWKIARAIELIKENVKLKSILNLIN